MSFPRYPERTAPQVPERDRCLIYIKSGYNPQAFWVNTSYLLLHKTILDIVVILYYLDKMAKKACELCL